MRELKGSLKANYSVYYFNLIIKADSRKLHLKLFLEIRDCLIYLPEEGSSENEMW